MDTSPPQESIAILIRNESDMNTTKEVFGDVLPVTLNDPRYMKDLLLQQSTLVRSCFIAVESTKLLTKSSSEVYLELLKTANEFVGKNISSPLFPAQFVFYPERWGINPVTPYLRTKNMKFIVKRGVVRYFV